MVGKIHRYETVNLITFGAVKSYNPEQPEAGLLMVAPYTFVSPAGSKRIVVAYQPSIWCTVHPAETEDLAQLEGELIVKNYDELDLKERAIIGDLTA